MTDRTWMAISAIATAVAAMAAVATVVLSIWGVGPFALVVSVAILATVLVPVFAYFLWHFTVSWLQGQVVHTRNQLLALSGEFQDSLEQANNALVQAKTMATEAGAFRADAEHRSREIALQLEEVEQQYHRLITMVSSADVDSTEPITLLERAKTAIEEGERASATIWLRKLADDGTASSEILSESGDLARDVLDNKLLAKELYLIAVGNHDENPIVFFKLISTIDARGMGVEEWLLVADEVRDIALTYSDAHGRAEFIPELYRALSNLESPETSLEIAESLIGAGYSSPTLRLIQAEAFRLLAKPVKETREAFEVALMCAKKEQVRSGKAKSEIIRAQSGFARFLLDVNDAESLSHAEALLHEALRNDPLNVDLHVLYGDLLQTQGFPRMAETSYSRVLWINAQNFANELERKRFAAEVLNDLDLPPRGDLLSTITDQEDELEDVPS